MAEHAEMNQFINGKSHLAMSGPQMTNFHNIICLDQIGSHGRPQWI